MLTHGLIKKFRTVYRGQLVVVTADHMQRPVGGEHCYRVRSNRIGRCTGVVASAGEDRQPRTLSHKPLPPHTPHDQMLQNLWPPLHLLGEPPSEAQPVIPSRAPPDATAAWSSHFERYGM